MKAVIFVFAVFGFLWSVSALPATSKPIDNGVEFVNPSPSYGEQPVVDTGVVFGEGSFNNPFAGLFDHFESMMNRVRQQMDSVWQRFPGFRLGNSTGDFPDFPSIGFPQLDIDLSKGNTTSVTKIIDGHKVVINQTEYHKDDDNSSAFFKIRIIDVQPQDNSTERDTEETTNKDSESLENTVDNEIFKNKEDNLHGQSLENFDYMDTQPYPSIPGFEPMDFNSDWIDDNRLSPIDGGFFNLNVTRDLSKDTYVNELLANSGATVNPDAEIIEIVPQVGGANRMVSRSSLINNRIPPIDLAKDLYVNDLLARSGATANPDAEIIEIVPQNVRGNIETFEDKR